MFSAHNFTRKKALLGSLLRNFGCIKRSFSLRRKVSDWCIEQPKVGVIGYGSIASKHIDILSNLCPSAKFHVLVEAVVSQVDLKTR